MDAAEIFLKFESLGDSCEFGFVQRHFGAEPVSLLRWAGSEIDGLVMALEAKFADILRMEDVRKSDPGVIIDKKYKLKFHSQVKCDENGLHIEPSNIANFNAYVANIKYMLRMFNETIMERGRIYVYKNNSGISLLNVLRLKTALDLHGPQKLLCVVPASAEWPAGQVRLIASGVKMAGIGRLAPYNRQEDSDTDAWLKICSNAIQSDWGHQNVEFGVRAAETSSGFEKNALVIATGRSDMLVTDRDAAFSWVTALRRTILPRETDTIGPNHHVDMLQHGHTIEQVIKDIFQLGDLTHKQEVEFITALYRTVLLREPEPAGLNHHVDKLRRGCTIAQLVEGFFRSDEFARKKRNFLLRYGGSSRETSSSGAAVA